MEKLIKVSICLCTRDRAVMLAKTLRSIINQGIPANWKTDIIVVNNSDDCKPQNIIDNIQEQSDLPIHLVNVKETGIPYARNAACQKSISLGAEWVIFIDDDEEALPGWLNAYAHALLTCKSDVLTGPVKYIFPGHHEKWLKNKGFPINKNGQFIKSAATNNVMLSTKLLTSHPPLDFDVNMALTGGSDTDFFSRYMHQGGKITAVSDAVVKEHVTENRTTLTWRLKRQMQSSSNRIYTSKKLYTFRQLLCQASNEITKRLLHGTLRTFTSPLWLLNGYYPFKKSLYHGLRHYAKAFGIVRGLLNRNYNLYEFTDGS